MFGDAPKMSVELLPCLQLALARTAIERAVVSLIYTHAMYPNGEVDVHRDQVSYWFIAQGASIHL